MSRINTAEHRSFQFDLLVLARLAHDFDIAELASVDRFPRRATVISCMNWVQYGDLRFSCRSNHSPLDNGGPLSVLARNSSPQIYKEYWPGPSLKLSHISWSSNIFTIVRQNLLYWIFQNIMYASTVSKTVRSLGSGSAAVNGSVPLNGDYPFVEPYRIYLEWRTVYLIFPFSVFCHMTSWRMVLGCLLLSVAAIGD